MGFQMSERSQALNEQLEAFMCEHIYPREHDWQEFTLNELEEKLYSYVSSLRGQVFVIFLLLRCT